MTIEKPSVFRLLLGSRKVVVGIVTALCSVGATLGTRFGLQIDAVTLTGIVVPIVLTGITIIYGIAHEDAAAKSAGAGTTTTIQTGSTSSGVEQVTTIKPDPTGAP